MLTSDFASEYKYFIDFGIKFCFSHQINHINLKTAYTQCINSCTVLNIFLHSFAFVYIYKDNILDLIINNKVCQKILYFIKTYDIIIILNTGGKTNVLEKI